MTNFTVSENQLLLKDILYEVTRAELFAEYQDMELILRIEVEADTDENDVEYDMCMLHLYHNNGFNTHTATLAELEGKKFVWTSTCNEADEEAGYLCVQEHEDVEDGTIEIVCVDMQEKMMTIRWSGHATVRWNEKYGEGVPFETIFTVEFPEDMSYCINAYKFHKMQIDAETELELTNLEQFNKKLSDLSGCMPWTRNDMVLEFVLTHQEACYLGKVIFGDNKNEYTMELDAACPCTIEFLGMDYNLCVKYEMFYFDIQIGVQRE